MNGDDKILLSLKSVVYIYFPKSLQGTKRAITMCPVSLELTLLLFLLI